MRNMNETIGNASHKYVTQLLKPDLNNLLRASRVVDTLTTSIPIALVVHMD